MNKMVVFFIYFVLQIPSLLTAEPLLGSNFAKNHNGVLPYSQCMVNIPYGPAMAIFLGGSIPLDHEAHLKCTSRKLNLKYVIPISVSSRTFIGMGVEVSLFPFEKLNIHGLSGKSLDAIEGTFGGYGVDFPLVVHTYGISFLQNEKKVTAEYDVAGIFSTGFKIGRTSMKIKLRDTISYTECKDKYMVISSDLSSKRTKQDCKVTVPSKSLGGNIEIRDMIPLKIEDIQQLTFTNDSELQ